MILWIIETILVGALVGWIAGKVMKTECSFWVNVLIGIGGSAIAGFLCRLIGIYSYGFIFGLIANVVGACLLIWIIEKVSNK